MAGSECAVYNELKDRETRAHAAWTSFLYRNEVKPRLSEKAKRKHQKEEMEAYQQAHKARLAHMELVNIAARHKREDSERAVARSEILLDIGSYNNNIAQAVAAVVSTKFFEIHIQLDLVSRKLTRKARRKLGPLLTPVLSRF